MSLSTPLEMKVKDCLEGISNGVKFKLIIPSKWKLKILWGISNRVKGDTTLSNASEPGYIG